MKDGKVTLWYRYDSKKEEYVYNHLEEGIAKWTTPVPMFKSQNHWKSGVWHKKQAEIKGGIVC